MSCSNLDGSRYKRREKKWNERKKGNMIICSSTDARVPEYEFE